MRNRTQGFTLIELLIVIAIIGILAAVLIPNLLNARARAFDTAAQTCLKEIATFEEITASVNPWLYNDGGLTKGYDGVQFTRVTGETADEPPVPITETFNIESCRNVRVAVSTVDTPDDLTEEFAYEADHNNGRNIYEIRSGRGVTFLAEK